LFNKACFYPNHPSGNFTRIGEGEGLGYNINIPWNKIEKKIQKKNRNKKEKPTENDE